MTAEMTKAAFSLVPSGNEDLWGPIWTDLIHMHMVFLADICIETTSLVDRTHI